MQQRHFSVWNVYVAPKVVQPTFTFQKLSWNPGFKAASCDVTKGVYEGYSEPSVESAC